MREDTIGELTRWAQEAGLGTPAEALHLVRAVLLVEGEHDRRVLRHLYGDQLAEQRIMLLPVRGAMKAPALIEAEFLKRFGVPLIILFDDIDARLATGQEKPPGSRLEARALWEMLQNWDSEETRPQVVSFPLPDILCTLPEPCVKDYLARKDANPFVGWEPLLREFNTRRSEGTLKGDFKSFFTGAVGLGADYDKDLLLGEILESCVAEDPPGSPLAAAMREVFAYATPDEVWDAF
jgi:hypothetical protein